MIKLEEFLVAMEWGYLQHEKGHNIQQARINAKKLWDESGPVLISKKDEDPVTSVSGPESLGIETWAKKLYSDHYHVDMSDAEWGKLSSNARQHWLDEAKRSIEFLCRRRRKDDIKPSAKPTPKK